MRIIAAAAVLAVARAVAARIPADIVAVHVRGTDDASIDGVMWTARRHDTALTVVDGGVVPALVGLLSADDVIVGVLGVRGRPQGRQPAGHTAMAIASSSPTPIIVTPPTAHDIDIRTVLVPVEGMSQVATGGADLVTRFAEGGADIRPLHVFVPATVPAFWDQPQHAAPAWSSEFVSRHGPRDAGPLWMRSGDVAEAVLDVVATAAVDLVALTWSQNATGGHAPVVRTLLARCPVPLLLAPANAD